MRIVALIYVAAAIQMWWIPLPRFAEFLLLALGAVLALALYSTFKRDEAAKKAARAEGGTEQR